MLHLRDLKLMIAQLRIIDNFILIAVTLRNDALHLFHQRLARGGHRLTRRFQSLLRLARKGRFHAAGSDKLRRASGDIVALDDELLGRVAAADDAVGRFDEHVGGGSHGLGGADEALGPAVVLLVEGRAGRSAPAFTHDFLLRFGGGFNKAGDGVCDGDGGFEDGTGKSC